MIGHLSKRKKHSNSAMILKHYINECINYFVLVNRWVLEKHYYFGKTRLWVVWTSNLLPNLFVLFLAYHRVPKPDVFTCQQNTTTMDYVVIYLFSTGQCETLQQWIWVILRQSWSLYSTSLSGRIVDVGGILILTGNSWWSHGSMTFIIILIH